tara:strand:- start:28476 stop:29168 length:693 start_codon:yes stop_codon:yes gene_type:complete
MWSIEEYKTIQQQYGNVNIELTNKCPLCCAQCFRAELKRDNTHPKKILIKEKIKESFDISLIDLRKLFNFFNAPISLCGQFSDPIYHKKFLDILDICTKEYSNKKFRIHTAAHQKNIEWYQTAFNKTGNNITWIFGLDGLANTSMIYRQGQNSKLIYDAMLLGAALKKNITWQYIVFKYNENQIEAAQAIAKENNIRFKLVYTDRTHGNVEIASKKYRASGNVKENKFLN